LLELDRLAHLAGTYELGLLLDDREQPVHHVQHLFGELARIGRSRDRRTGRRCLPRLRMLAHVMTPLDQPRFACCRINVRDTSLEMPTPPALAKDFEYSYVSIERHTPVPGVSPNGPSPLMPLVICENIWLRNIASKSCAWPRSFFCVAADTLVNASASCGSARL